MLESTGDDRGGAGQEKRADDSNDRIDDQADTVKGRGGTQDGAFVGGCRQQENGGQPDEERGSVDGKLEGVQGCPWIDRLFHGASHGLDEVIETLVVASLPCALKREGCARAHALITQTQGLVEELPERRRYSEAGGRAIHVHATETTQNGRNQLRQWRQLRDRQVDRLIVKGDCQWSECSGGVRALGHRLLRVGMVLVCPFVGCGANCHDSAQR